MTFNNSKIRLLSAALFASLILSACGGTPEHTEAATGEHAEQGQGVGAEEAHHSSAGLPNGTAEAGAKLADSKDNATKQSCFECHGPEGAAPVEATYPALAGQYSDYISHSLVAYRDGQRTNSVMAGQAAHLTDQQIADLGAYFASRKAKVVDLTTP